MRLRDIRRKLAGARRGRPPKLSPAQVDQLCTEYAAGSSKNELCRVWHISVETLYRTLASRCMTLRSRKRAPEPAPREVCTCWVCGGASATWDGHPHCRGRAA